MHLLRLETPTEGRRWVFSGGSHYCLYKEADIHHTEIGEVMCKHVDEYYNLYSDSDRKDVISALVDDGSTEAKAVLLTMMDWHAGEDIL